MIGNGRRGEKDWKKEKNLSVMKKNYIIVDGWAGAFK